MYNSYGATEWEKSKTFNFRHLPRDLVRNMTYCVISTVLQLFGLVQVIAWTQCWPITQQHSIYSMAPHATNFTHSKISTFKNHLVTDCFQFPTVTEEQPTYTAETCFNPVRRPWVNAFLNKIMMLQTFNSPNLILRLNSAFLTKLMLKFTRVNANELGQYVNKTGKKLVTLITLLNYAQLQQQQRETCNSSTQNTSQ